MTHLPTILRGIPVALQPKIVSEHHTLVLGLPYFQNWYLFSGWWFQICFIFTPIWERWTHFDFPYFSRKNHPTTFLDLLKNEPKNHPAEVVSWPPEKKPPRDFSVSIENRGGEHPSTFYLPALVWVIFIFPPDEWIFHLWGRCFFSRIRYSKMMCFCFFAHNLFGRLLLKMCQLFFWKEKRLCLPGRLAPF